MTTPVPHAGGWGSQSWGGSGWGGGEALAGGVFSALSAYAPAENIIRLVFSQAPYFSGVFDEYDASDLSHYSVTANALTTGWDGEAARAVLPAEVVVSGAPNALDVYLDRPLSPFPAEYVIAVENLASSGQQQVIASASFSLFGVYRRLVPQLPELTVPTADFANPQTASAVQSGVLGAPYAGSAYPLGVFRVDDSGDYAFDAGVQVVKKRILRRGVTKKGAFAHLPATYGVGLLDACKKLGKASVRARYASDYQAQILQEPEVVAAKVVAIPDPGAPSLIHFVITVQTRTGASFTLDHPVDTVAGVSRAFAGA
jgi:hypothetical protein